MTSARPPAPVLKWPGGKRQLLPQLRRFYPARVQAYHEPFLGSAAVFFDLHACGVLHEAHHISLSDQNADLIGTYQRLADATDAVLTALDALDGAHHADPRAHYYRVRDDEFNPRRAAWRAQGADLAAFGPELAAMFIYLNRTGYNGLFRLNADGRFNVPAGRYARPRIVITERIRAALPALTAPPVRVWCAPFERALATVGRGDFVYLDPPYAPLTTTASFRSYTADGFTGADQRRLRDVVLDLAARGAEILLSNSTAPSVVALYDTREARRAGLRCRRVPARRAINSRADRRGPIEELIVSTRPARE